MGTERSDKVHDTWRQASEKLDYFITGLTGALCAYISQTFQPEKISLSPGTLELISLLILVFSVFSGFKRIEKIIQSHAYNHRSLYIAEQTGELVSNYSSGLAVNKETGEVLTPAQIEERVRKLKEVKPDVDKFADDAASAAGFWYTIRNYALLVGFLTLVASKVWAVYV